MKTLALLILCIGSVVLADDFKTTEGKEYKNVTVSRVEPDGIVLVGSSGVSKVYFAELPREVQERFHYNAAEAAAYSAEQVANSEAFSKQRQESEQQRVDERKKYWSEHPTPLPRGDKLSTFGSSLDSRGYNQSTTVAFLFSQYATNQVNADR
jgi:hypothetical protein